MSMFSNLSQCIVQRQTREGAWRDHRTFNSLAAADDYMKQGEEWLVEGQLRIVCLVPRESTAELRNIEASMRRIGV